MARRAVEDTRVLCSRMGGRRVFWLVIALLFAAPAGVASAASCPVAPDAAALPNAKELKREHAFLGRLGARPTGSHGQRVYINWIRRRLAEIPGVQTHDLNYGIRRWSLQSTTLRVRIDGKARTLPVADAIPYSKPTSRRGVAGPAVLDPRRSADHRGQRARARRRAPGPGRLRADVRLPAAGRRRGTRTTRGTRSTRAGTSTATSSTTTRARPTCARPPRPARRGCCSSRSCRARRRPTTTSPTRGRPGACPGCSSAATRARSSPTRSPAGTGRRCGSSSARASSRSRRRRSRRRCRAATRTGSSSTATPTGPTRSRTTARSR